ncbi:hypothetical protein [Pseudoalteromonas porphyrae]|nr:hypothetical protein [Pseudoalteromonas porphyrae]
MKNNKYKQLAFSQTFYYQMNQATELGKAIRKNVEAMGYGL